MIACNNVQQPVEVKTTTQIFGDQIWIKACQNQASNWDFCHFLKFGLLVFLSIA